RRRNRRARCPSAETTMVGGPAIVMPVRLSSGAISFGRRDEQAVRRRRASASLQIESQRFHLRQLSSPTPCGRGVQVAVRRSAGCWGLPTSICTDVAGECSRTRLRVFVSLRGGSPTLFCPLQRPPQ